MYISPLRPWTVLAPSPRTPVHPPLHALCPSTLPIPSTVPTVVPFHRTHHTPPPYPPYPSTVPTISLHRTHRTLTPYPPYPSTVPTAPIHRTYCTPPPYPPYPSTVPTVPLHRTHRTRPTVPRTQPTVPPDRTLTAHASKKHMFSDVLNLDIYIYIHIYGKSQCSMGKLTISIAIFKSNVTNHQRVACDGKFGAEMDKL